MSIFRRVKTFFSGNTEPEVVLDKWGDPWINKVIYQGRQPDLAACQRKNSFAHNKCPHCGQEELKEGPRGPGSVNCLCAACGSQFNDGGVFGVDLLRDCTDPIPEISDREATHDHNGPIVRKPVQETVRETETTSRRDAIVAQKARQANGGL